MMVGRKMLVIGLTLMLPLLKVSAVNAQAQTLDEAIASMRSIRVEDFDIREKREMKIKELNKAWETLKAAGDAGVERIKQELSTLEKTGEKDDYFRISASMLLYHIGELKEAATMARALKDADIGANFDQFFYLCHFLSRHQKPEALPILKNILRMKDETALVPEHALTVAWPLALDFTYGLYGRGSTEHLTEILKTSKDARELKSALYLLGVFRSSEVLPIVRGLVNSADSLVASEACRTLGVLGRPADAQILIQKLQAKDDDVVYGALFGLYEIEYQGDTSPIVDKLSHESKKVRSEAYGLLLHMGTVESVKACLEAVGQEREEKLVEAVKRRLQRIAESEEMALEELKKLPTQQLEQVLEKVKEKREERYRLKPGDRKLTPKEFQVAMDLWMKAHRITGGMYEWVEERHVLAVATAADIPGLLDVRSSLFWRLSDECLYEVRTIDYLIGKLYRKQFEGQ